MAFVALTNAETDAQQFLRQALFKKLKDNFDDHEARILLLSIQNSEQLYSDFGIATIDPDDWDVLVTPPGAGPVTGNGHVLDMNIVAAAESGIAGGPKRMRFKLNDDQSLIYEAKVKDITGIPSNHFYGFQDDTITSANTITSTESDVVAWLKGTNAGTYRFRVAKAGTATTTDNIGSRSVYGKLRIEIVRTAGITTIKAFIDGTEISGSPFTTNIPDTKILRPVCGIKGTSVRALADYVKALWSAQPLMA